MPHLLPDARPAIVESIAGLRLRGKLAGYTDERLAQCGDGLEYPSSAVTKWVLLPMFP